MDAPNIDAYVDLMARAIETQDLELVQLCLEESPLDQIDAQYSNSFLKYFLELCEYVNAWEPASMIIQHWENVNPVQEDMPIRTTIWTFTDLRPSTAVFVARTDPNGCWIGYMMSLSFYPSGPEVLQGCTMITSLYGEQTLETYKEILLHLDLIRNELGETNDVMYDYVDELYKMVSEYAPIPEWITQGTYEVLPTHDELLASLPKPPETQMFEVPDNDTAVQMLTDITYGLPGMQIDDYNRFKDQLEERFSGVDPTEKIRMVKELIRHRDEYDLHSNPDIFRVLGPAHAMTGSDDLDTSSPSPCSKWGSHRLMTCFEFENFDEDGEVYDENIEITGNYDAIDWYTGACVLCKRRIRAKHHAVRMPMESGAWVGCYCSWKHVRDDIARPNDILLGMVDRFEEQYKTFKIQDRVWPVKEIEPLPLLSYDEFIIQAEILQGDPVHTSLQIRSDTFPLILPRLDGPVEPISYSTPTVTEMTYIRTGMYDDGS
jgi:hypothetical protein